MRILVTGGAGYVGSVLVPRLVACGHHVVVLDTFWYGRTLQAHDSLTQLQGDIRDRLDVQIAVADCDAVIHLACVSNDPSFDLDPKLGESINGPDTMRQLVYLAQGSGVKQFIYASSSSVYGIQDGDCDESAPLNPLTDYSRFKVEGEQVLAQASREMDYTIVRPATVCGYSPRQRLDVIVNIFTNQAWNTGRVMVNGGTQLRPNIHIADMCSVYELLLISDRELINRQTFNAGHGNATVLDIAKTVQRVVSAEKGEAISLGITTNNDKRSYHVSSEKLARVLGFRAEKSISDAARDLCRAFKGGKLPESMTDPRYFNIKIMQGQNG